MGIIKRVGYFVILVAVIGGGQAILGGDLQANPDPQVESMSKPTVQMIDHGGEQVGDGYRYTATIQNTGQAGNSFITLWLGQDTPETLPDTKSGLKSEGFDRIRTQTAYFNEGERRTVSFNEDNIESQQSFAVYAFASTYSATIINEGGTGDVNVSLLWENSKTEDTKLVDSKIFTLQEDGSKQVEFSVKEHPKFHYPNSNFDTWKVTAEPA